MASRRTESMRGLAEQEATSKSEAERRVREATEEATKRRQDAINESTTRLREATDEAHRRVQEATEEANRRISHARATGHRAAAVADQARRAAQLGPRPGDRCAREPGVGGPGLRTAPGRGSGEAGPHPRPTPAPPKENWESDTEKIPDTIAQAPTKRIARKP